MGLFGCFVMGTLFFFIFGGGVLPSLDNTVLFFKGFNVVLGLPPVGEVMACTQLRTLFDSFADSVKEQIDVSWKVNVSFGHKGVAATAQVDGVLF